MQYIPIYFPTRDLDVWRDEVTDDHIQAELEHYLGEVRGRFERNALSFTEDDENKLYECIHHYLSSAFHSPSVSPSSWSDEPWKTHLGDLWTSGTNAALLWRKKLREHHEAILRCPFCGMLRDPSFEGDSLPIDHYLPKSLWPELSIVATNLVPICDTCNTRLKKVQAPIRGGSRLFLHPYYDCFVTQMRLVAQVNFTGADAAPSIRFFLDTSSVSEEQSHIAFEHMNRLNLKTRFLHQATHRSLATIHGLIARQMKIGELTTADSIGHWLHTYTQTLVSQRGSMDWEPALFNALEQSPQFWGWALRTANRECR